MRDILQARLARLAEVEQAMADPDLVNDQVRYRQLTSEHKELSEALSGRNLFFFAQGLNGISNFSEQLLDTLGLERGV